MEMMVRAGEVDLLETTGLVPLEYDEDDPAVAVGAGEEEALPTL